MSPPGVDTHRNRHRLPVPVVRSLLAALVAMVGGVSVLSVAAPAATADTWAPVHPGDFPDPSITYVPGSGGSPGVYYAFSTQNFAAPSQTHQRPGLHIAQRYDVDPAQWRGRAAPSPVVGQGGGDLGAERRLQQHGQRLRHVLHGNGVLVGRPVHRHGHCTCARSDSAPTRDTSAVPAVCQNGSDAGSTVDNGNYGGSIDPDVFTDPTSGNSWLIWKSDGNHIGEGDTSIWSVPLTSHLAPVDNTTPTNLLTGDPDLAEQHHRGPRHVYEPASGGTGGTYYLFYAGSTRSVDLRHRLGDCANGAAGACTRPVDVEPVARLGARRVRAGRT